MKVCSLFFLCFLCSCSMLGLNRDYTRPCEKLVTKLEADKELLVVKGYGQVISTNYSKYDNRMDSAGDHAFFERAKSDMLQKLYRNKSEIDISTKDTVAYRRGKVSVQNSAKESAYFKSKRMVTVTCNGNVYGIVDRESFR